MSFNFAISGLHESSKTKEQIENKREMEEQQQIAKKKKNEKRFNSILNGCVCVCAYKSNNFIRNESR